MVDDRDDPPIATATVARLYMEQGKLTQAERLFRLLLVRSPLDPALSSGLAEVQRRRELAAAPTGADRISLGLDDAEVACTWHVTAEGLDRARLVLDGTGQLSLKVATFPIHPASETGQIIPLPAEQLTGVIRLETPPGATMIAAAVGLAAATGRFVAVAHCPAIKIPPPKEIQ